MCDQMCHAISHMICIMLYCLCILSSICVPKVPREPPGLHFRPPNHPWGLLGSIWASWPHLGSQSTTEASCGPFLPPACNLCSQGSMGASIEPSLASAVFPESSFWASRFLGRREHHAILELPLLPSPRWVCEIPVTSTLPPLPRVVNFSSMR